MLHMDILKASGLGLKRDVRLYGPILKLNAQISLPYTDTYGAT